ncbi:MAG TPA: dUTP diphosphatase [Acidimicrobiia bacterium]
MCQDSVSVVDPPGCPTNSSDVQVTFTRLDRELPPPEPARPGDAGFDLRTTEDVALDPGGRAAVPTGLAIAFPPGHAALVLPRSGLAAKHGIGLVNAPGLIDSGYRGEIKVLLVNHGDASVQLKRGERIAQLLFVGLADPQWHEADELPESERGEGGFGSTGS